MLRKRNIPKEPIEITIDSLSHDGRGIARVNGKVTFISDALPNEKVIFKYTKKHGSFDEGQTIEVLQKSNERVLPICKHCGVCGGCSLQHLNNDAQIALKQKSLLDLLLHSANITPKEIMSPIKGTSYGYRHKARLGVRFVSKKETILVGFREKNGRFISDIESCKILHPSIGEKILSIRQLISSLEIFQHIPQLEIAVGDSQSAIVIRHLKPFNSSDIEKILEFAKTNQLDIYLQPDNLESIHKIWPQDKINELSYFLPDQHIELFFHPCDFTQINLELNRKMVSQALKLLDPCQNEQILDLFCGLGNFTLPIAKHCSHVVGVEGDEKMVLRAKKNALHNNIKNIDFYAANLTSDISTLSWAKQHFDKILLDPPRTGAQEVIKYFKNFNTKKIVYVSCNMATFARDAAYLVNNQGFQLQKIGIMDMFPHTSHVESIALFIN